MQQTTFAPGALRVETGEGQECLDVVLDFESPGVSVVVVKGKWRVGEPFKIVLIAWRQSPRRRIEQVVRGICPKRLDFGPARNVKPVGFTVEPRVSNRIPLKIKALR
jgi:hypothetical protein